MLYWPSAQQSQGLIFPEKLNIPGYSLFIIRLFTLVCMAVIGFVLKSHVIKVKNKILKTAFLCTCNNILTRQNNARHCDKALRLIENFRNLANNQPLFIIASKLPSCSFKCLQPVVQQICKFQHDTYVHPNARQSAKR